MQFGKGEYLWLLGMIPLLALFYGMMFQKRRKALFQFADPQVVEKLLVAVSPFKRKIKVALFLFSLSFMIFSLMEPKWGFHMEEVRRRGIDLVIALDVSKSMLAQDVKPDRLSRAKLEIESLFERLGGDRVALVGFAGSAFIQCPLTLDYATAKLFLEDMTIQSIPRGGTDIGGAILKSLEAFQGEGGGEEAVILLTDGEDHGTALSQALEKAKKKKVTLYPVGIGKREGAPIPLTDEEGKIQYLRDSRGEVVLSRLDLRLLERIAAVTGGKGGVIGSGDFSLEALYEREISRLGKTELTSHQKKEYHHRFQWPLALAIACLVAEGILSERR